MLFLLVALATTKIEVNNMTVEMAMKTRQEVFVSINPECPDDWWVSPSGSNSWCKVGDAKRLVAAHDILVAEVRRMRAELSVQTSLVERYRGSAKELNRARVTVESKLEQLQNDVEMEKRNAYSAESKVESLRQVLTTISEFKTFIFNRNEYEPSPTEEARLARNALNELERSQG